MTDTTPAATGTGGEPLLVEDVLLLLFQPSSGVIAGETTLFYVLGGAVAAELAVRGHVRVTSEGFSTRVETVGAPPRDPILRTAWDYVAVKPRDAQTLIAAIGPDLRATVLERLAERGDLVLTRGKALGFFPTEKIEASGDRRAALLARVRAALVDGVEPDARTAATAALLSASGSLTWFDPEIPWRTPVIERAKQLESGDWGATAAAEAVTRTMLAVLNGAVLAAVTAATAGRS